MERNHGACPWNIEIFAGAATDANAPVFFNGAMDVLQPKIDDGTPVAGVLSPNDQLAEGILNEPADRDLRERC